MKMYFYSYESKLLTPCKKTKKKKKRKEAGEKFTSKHIHYMKEKTSDNSLCAENGFSMFNNNNDFVKVRRVFIYQRIQPNLLYS